MTKNDKIKVLIKKNKKLRKEVVRLSKLENEDIIKCRYSRNLANYAEKTYFEENERKNSLMTQASYILIAISILIAFLGGILPFLANELKEIIETNKLLFYFSMPFLFLLTSFVLSILIYWRSKYEALTSGFLYQKHVDKHYDNYVASEWQYYYDLFDNYSKAFNSIFIKNNSRVKLAIASHIALFAAILLILIIAICIILKLA